MAMIPVLKHLIHQEACYPALKLVWDDQVDTSEFGDLPKITPTHYVNENRMSTEERHKLLCRQQRKMVTRKLGTEVVVEPPIIVFQNYLYGEKYTFPITVRNISKNSQKIALLMDESFAFKFDECSQRVAKFPCGMCITAAITFTPDNEMEDCYHRLVVSTNKTKIAVPIIAIGPRPLLNLPDSFVLEDAPVRYWTVKPITILNTGRQVASFSLSATGSFCVKPEKGIVPPNQGFTFEISYYSAVIGTHEGELCLKYDNGEEVFVYLRGNTVNCDIQLSSSDVHCENTFMGLQTRATFYIENRSKINAKFYWKMLKDAPISINKQSTLINGPQKSVSSIAISQTSSEESRNSEETEIRTEISNGGGDQPLKEEQEAAKMESEEEEGVINLECDKDLFQIQASPDHLFSNDNFHVYPLFGEIKPFGKTEIHIVFSPTECAFYNGIAYLEVNGLDQRLPFSFYGRGLGPKFRLGFEVLDVGDVALGGAHTYEVPVQNISEIPGSMQCDGLVGPPSGMGMKIEPLLLDIAPGQYGAFYVNFSCTGKPGPFEDEIKFSTCQTGDVFYVTVKGKITYPSIRFANHETHMGNLSYGFPRTFYIPLVNDSMNFVDVELKMESDGTDPPVDFNTFLKSFKQKNFRFDKQPAEFKVNPVKFTLRPKGLQRVQLTMYPNQVREVKNKLKCWITDDDGKDVETVACISIRGQVIVPMLQAIKDSVYLKDCYLQYPYQGEFVIKNTSALPVMYCVVHKPTNLLKVDSEYFVGVAEPWVETKIPFDVICLQSGGEALAYFDLYAVGNDAKMLSLFLRCEPIPSKVEASNRNVDFGKIEVLEEKILSVDIINTSPLAFPFTASIFLDEPSDKGESWRVDPETGLLPSQSRVTLMVHLQLKEVGYHYAGVRMQMTEPLKHIIEVRMKALGVGSPLLITPHLDKFATVNFETIFVKQDRTFEFDITNRSVNPRVLEWKAIGEKGPSNRPWESKAIMKKHKEELAATKKISEVKPKAKRKKESPINTKSPKASARPPFTITPMKAVIPPGATTKLTITSYSSVPKVLEEVWNLWSYVPATKGHEVDDDAEGQSMTQTSSKNIGPSKKKSYFEGTKEKRKQINANEPQNLHLRPVIIHEAKLLAIYEAPGLKFSKRVIDFIIEATPSHEHFVMQESLKIENIGNLPLKVRMRTKFPFSFHERSEDMPTEEGVYSFDIQKSLSFKIQFDGRHLRKELAVVNFDGRLEAHYEGLQGTEYVDLHGEVRFPQVTMDRDVIDFGTLTNGMEAVEQINITNTCAFCLTYKWYIKPGTTNIEKNAEVTPSKEFCFDSYKPSMKHRLLKFKHKNSTLTSDSAAGTLVPIATLLQNKKALSTYGPSSKDHIAQALGISSGAIQDGETNYEDFTEYLEEKMYRSRMMEFMGLKDPEFEAEDEVNYLAYYNQNAVLPKEEFSTNEIIDIIPLGGVIESGKSQTFTVVFYGYPDIDFETSLVMYIEGGARKTVEVRGRTVSPDAPPYLTD